MVVYERSDIINSVYALHQHSITKSAVFFLFLSDFTNAVCEHEKQTKWETAWWCKRERKEGNERLLACWALANKRVLSHYSHTAQCTGQSGDNECGVWCLAFLPSSCTSCLPTLLLCFPFLHPSCAAVFLTTSSTVCFHFCRFNYLLVCFASWFLVVTNVRAGKCLSFALVSSKLIGQLFTFTVHGLVCMNGKGRLF